MTVFLTKIPHVAHLLSNRLSKAGAEVHLVGGAVRDLHLGQTPKDLDFVLGGDVTADLMVQVLSDFGSVSVCGASFGVAKLTVKDLDFDFALRRKESKQGTGHKGFVVEHDPNLPIETDLARRDFTINAMAVNMKSGDVVDPFNGQNDLADRLLRHSSVAFAEDPLRVLRGMQFCGRFDATVDTKTAEFCRQLKGEFVTLSRDRVFGEFSKLFLKADAPSRGLMFLQATGWLALFPELALLQGVEQDQRFHPEGDVFTHTALTLDAMQFICVREGLRHDDRMILMLAALCHDFGKPATTFRDGGKVHSYGHEQAGLEPTKTFLARIGTPQRLIAPVLSLVQCHLDGFQATTPKAVRRLAAKLDPATIEDLALLMEADMSGRAPIPAHIPQEVSVMLDVAAETKVENTAPKQLVMGRHLLHLMKPGPQLGVVLKDAYEAQLDGTFQTTEAGVAWVEQNL